MVSREMIAIYCESYEIKKARCVGRMHSFLLLQQVVRVVTTGI